MAFQNENTFQKYLNDGNERFFHSQYEQAVKGVKLDFGKTYPILINGKKVTGTKRVVHTSPNNREITLGYIQQVSSKQVSQAIRAAAHAFKIWGNMDYRRRVRIFKKIVELMRSRKFELAAWLSFENGKNRYEAVADVDEAIDFISYYIEEMTSNHGFVSLSRAHARNEKNTSIMKPYGVWAIIAPFNFPAAILVGMATGALITGNTVIIKPASDTPIIGYIITEIMIKAGIPSGVVNFVTGPGGEIGRLLVESKDIVGIVFTGSREVGYELIRRSSEIRPRPVIAELGGKNAAIVTKTADLDTAVDGVMKAAFSYSAQKCSACSRVYVQKDIKSQFVKKLVKKTDDLIVGNPIKAETFVGPLINSNSYRNFQAYSKLASKDGKVLTKSSLKKDNNLEKGLYVRPTIVVDLPKNHILFKKELFVPILCVSEYGKFDDALALCNKSEYGLTAGIYTKDKKEIEKFLNEIEAGVIYVNRKSSATTGAMVGRQSFGGWKDSGTTGKGTGGKYYLTQFMREQSQTIIE
jgi:1-pyrroline-5-carboxylate dehydrogenase